ncbi:MAG TPA: hypothetical protein VFV38_24870 [Ktedonobacteraceae bacterium]|nr:hypothetical protein [Ktedonobacteraceae bacterium]
MVECPQCGMGNENTSKNCKACCVNLYWAFQHYEELTALRQSNNLSARSETPDFLIKTSKKVDEGPTVGWLRSTIAKLGFKEAGKKVSTMTES